MDGMSVINTETGKIWSDLLDHARKVTREQAVETWLKPVKPLGLDGSTLNLLVPNRFFREYLQDRFASVLSDGLREITGRDFTLNLIVDDTAGDDSPPPPSPRPARWHGRCRWRRR